jgi:hypothetical protein
MSHAAEPDLRAAHAALLALEEAERQRIAHELHSEIGQDLTAVLLGLQFFAEEGVPADEIPELIQSLRRALERVRALSLRLRPPLLDEIGLGPALHSSLSQIAAQRGLELTLDLPTADHPFEPLPATLLFRALQALLLELPAPGPWHLYLHGTDAIHIELRSVPGAEFKALAELLDRHLYLLGPQLSLNERGLSVRLNALR